MIKLFVASLKKVVRNRVESRDMGSGIFVLVMQWDWYGCSVDKLSTR